MVYILLDEPLTPHDSDIEETQRWPQPGHLRSRFLMALRLAFATGFLAAAFSIVLAVFVDVALRAFLAVVAVGRSRLAAPRDAAFSADAVGFAVHKPCLAKTEPSG